MKRPRQRPGKSKRKSTKRRKTLCKYQKMKGICAAPVERIFTYNKKEAAFQMRTNLKQIVKHTKTIYGHEIRNDPHNKKIVIIYKPQHAHAVLDHIQDMVATRENIFMCLQSA